MKWGDVPVVQLRLCAVLREEQEKLALSCWLVAWLAVLLCHLGVISLLG